MVDSVVLVGASVRAAAFSALRAGYDPICIDLYADWDLCQVATSHRVERQHYPSEFLQFARQFEGNPWLFTGGLENYPGIIDSLAAHGPLWGASARVLPCVRNPAVIHTKLLAAGISTPAVAFAYPHPYPTRNPVDRPYPPAIPGPHPNTIVNWLEKPRTGSGGIGIRIWRGGKIPRGSYLQAFVHGVAHAAVFLGSSTGARLVGVTRQLIGESFCNAPEFAYCGSIGPVNVTPAVEHQLEVVGNTIVNDIGVRGIFGVDFILDGETVQPIEVNPRYSASVEILELALNTSCFRMHARVFQNQGDYEPAAVTILPARSLGKCVLYAQSPCRVKRDAPCYRQPVNVSNYQYADVPRPGAVHLAGEPILTLFAAADSITSCESVLREKSQWFFEGLLEQL